MHLLNADLHSHSNVSDGTLSPDILRNYDLEIDPAVGEIPTPKAPISGQ